MARKTNKKRPENTTEKPKKKKKGSVLKSSTSFIQSDKLKLGIGVFFLLFALYLTFSFSSYFFQWTSDFDIVYRFQWEDINSLVPIKNWGGFLGAWISHFFIYKMFGLASILFILLFFLMGSKLVFGIQFLPIKKTFKISFGIMIWSSVFFGSIFRDSIWAILGGTFGHQSSLWIQNLMGYSGLIILLFFSLVLFLIVHFRFPLIWFKDFQEKRKEGNLNKAAKLKSGTKSDKYNTEEYAVGDEDTAKETETNIDDEFVEDDSKSIESKVNHIKENIVDFETEIEPKPKSKAIDMNLDLEIDVAANTINVRNEKPEKSSEVPLGENQDDQELQVETGTEEKVKENRSHGIDTPYDPREDLADYVFPSADLLEDYGNDKINIYKEELELNKNRIVETLEHYKIKIQKIKATVGPTITLYEIVPAPGVRISKIKNLEDDIALSLAALGIRIIAPIPGKGSIGIEVPNAKPEMVPMSAVIQSKIFQESKYDLPVVMGKTISNESYTFDLAKMPHLLMAGATGQGKSVGLNAIIASLLYKKHPSELKFIMVDPKKVELTLFSKIERHFLAKLPDSEEAVITDTKAVVHTLLSLTTEMDNRYDLLKDAQVRNIKEYNVKFIARRLNPENGHKFMPYIVLVVDEFADLMMTAGKEIEAPIARLAQLARAIGIHLIIATQRPSVNVITGIIKANFPARIAFRVTSRIDSRTILDAGGADQLIGRGDMLMSTGNEMTRIQCAFIDTPEVERITDFIGSQRAYTSALLLPETETEASEQSSDMNPADRDELFEDAARIIVNAQQGSTSMIQRKLKLGYNRAGRIIDQLEAAGIVGQFEGSKAREVRVANEMALEQFLKDLYIRDQA